LVLGFSKNNLKLSNKATNKNTFFFSSCEQKTFFFSAQKTKHIFHNTKNKKPENKNTPPEHACERVW